MDSQNPIDSNRGSNILSSEELATFLTLDPSGLNSALFEKADKIQNSFVLVEIEQNLAMLSQNYNHVVHFSVVQKLKDLVENERYGDELLTIRKQAPYRRITNQSLESLSVRDADGTQNGREIFQKEKEQMIAVANSIKEQRGLLALPDNQTQSQIMSSVLVDYLYFIYEKINENNADPQILEVVESAIKLVSILKVDFDTPENPPYDYLQKKLMTTSRNIVLNIQSILKSDDPAPYIARFKNINKIFASHFFVLDYGAQNHDSSDVPYIQSICSFFEDRNKVRKQLTFTALDLYAYDTGASFNITPNQIFNESNSGDLEAVCDIVKYVDLAQRRQIDEIERDGYVADPLQYFLDEIIVKRQAHGATDPKAKRIHGLEAPANTIQEACKLVPLVQEVLWKIASDMKSSIRTADYMGVTLMLSVIDDKNPALDISNEVPLSTSPIILFDFFKKQFDKLDSEGQSRFKEYIESISYEGYGNWSFMPMLKRLLRKDEYRFIHLMNEFFVRGVNLSRIVLDINGKRSDGWENLPVADLRRLNSMLNNV